MSLNGLDSEAITEAYRSAVSENGGWLLVKYANRDTVELLDSGLGGVGEARAALEKYVEKSPVYGLVHYRRKKFVLKYVPDGTSRLLQVRLAVQFQSILETFTPHDTVFSFSQSSELCESALGLSTVMQATSSKTSSSSSLRQQRLAEITEVNEDVPKDKGQPIIPNSTKTVHDSYVSEPVVLDYLDSNVAADKLLPDERRGSGPAPAASTTLEDAPHFLQSDRKPSVSQIAIANEMSDTRLERVMPPHAKEEELPNGPTAESSPMSLGRIVSAYGRPSTDFSFSIPPIESDSDDDVRRPVPKEYQPIHYSNHLTAAESTSISKWSNEVVASTESKPRRASRHYGEQQYRPKTSGNNDETSVGRRANLPMSVRISHRGASQLSRPASQHSARSVPARFVPSPNLPPLPSPTPSALLAERPHPVHAPSQSSSMVDNPAAAPAKLRLMKALQMRKRNQLLAQRSASVASRLPSTLESSDSSLSAISTISTAASTSDERLKASVNEPILSSNESQTTSPTSVISPSDDQSTKPSSFCEQNALENPQPSLASETNSSTTPKAEPQEKAVKDSESSSSAFGTGDAILGNVALSPIVDIGDRDEHSSNPTAMLSSPASSNVTLRGTKPATTQEAHPTLSGSGNVLPMQTPQKSRHFEGRIMIPSTKVDNSDASDDDSVLEELQNATVQEAQHVSVNRSPMTPVLARVPHREIRDTTPVRMAMPKSRSPSNGSVMSTPDKLRATSRASSARSLSGALPQWPPPTNEPMPVLPRTKTQISAGISRRVKTFEGLSQRETSIGSINAVKDQPARTSTFSNILKRASFLTHTPSDEKTPEKPMPGQIPSPVRAGFEREAEPPNSRVLIQRPGTSAEVYSPAHKGETVSITARIVRDPTKPRTADGTSKAWSMHWSPLIVEHESQEGTGTRPTAVSKLNGPSLEPPATPEHRRLSLSSAKFDAGPLSPAESKSHHLSISKKQKKASSETSSVTDEKRASRTSRLLKRLSGLGRSRNRESVLQASPTHELVQPDTIDEQSETPVKDHDESMRAVVEIGEVNVQFPDSLLWKRRFLRVDDTGYLIFAPPINDLSIRGKSRKIHLDEMLQPALPDLEREQMAWSIVLDLKNGGTVQCACENRAAQISFLGLLVDAHNAYNQLYS